MAQEAKEDRMAVGVRFKKELNNADRKSLAGNLDSADFGDLAITMGFVETEVNGLRLYVENWVKSGGLNDQENANKNSKEKPPIEESNGVENDSKNVPLWGRVLVQSYARLQNKVNENEKKQKQMRLPLGNVAEDKEMDDQKIIEELRGNITRYENDKLRGEQELDRHRNENTRLSTEFENDWTQIYFDVASLVGGLVLIEAVIEAWVRDDEDVIRAAIIFGLSILSLILWFLIKACCDNWVAQRGRQAVYVVLVRVFASISFSETNATLVTIFNIISLCIMTFLLIMGLINMWNRVKRQKDNVNRRLELTNHISLLETRIVGIDKAILDTRNALTDAETSVARGEPISHIMMRNSSMNSSGTAVSLASSSGDKDNIMNDFRDVKIDVAPFAVIPSKQGENKK